MKIRYLITLPFWLFLSSLSAQAADDIDDARLAESSRLILEEDNWELFLEAEKKQVFDTSSHGIPINMYQLYFEKLPEGRPRPASVWYRKTFRLDHKPQQDYILYLGRIAIADKTWINGSLVGSTGSVYLGKVLGDAAQAPRIYRVPREVLRVGENSIAIKVMTGKSVYRGGFWGLEDRYLQGSFSFYRDYIRENLYTLVLILFVFVIGTYHIILYSRIKRSEENLYFGLFAYVIGLYFISINNFTYFLLSSNFYSMLRTLEYIALFASPLPFLYFITQLFHRKTPLKNRVLLATIVVQALGIGIVLWGNNSDFWIYWNRYIYRSALLIQVIITLLVLVKETRKQNSEARIILVGVLIFFAAIGYDILAITMKIPYLGLALSGFTFLMINFAWILGSRYTQLYREVDKEANLLEVKVRERTEELQKAVQQLHDRNQQHDKDLRLARIIQMNLLPAHPEELEQLNFIAHYLPMDDLGGDFYDYYRLSSSRTGFLLADVAGHGVAAALVSMMLKLAFVAEAKTGQEPAEVLRKVNNNMLSHLTTGEFFTCVYGIVDTDTKMFTYASGGHLPVLHYQKKPHSLQELDNTGPILGFRSDIIFEQKQITLENGDRLIFFTDGVIEARNLNEDEFGLERLKESIIEQANLPVDQSVRGLMKSLFSYSGDWTVQDDLTLFIVEIDGN